MPIQEEILLWRPCSNHWGCLKYIGLGGLASGLSFLLYQVLTFLLLSRYPALPLKLFAALFLGRAAVIGGYPMAEIVLVGLVSVLTISIVSAFLLVFFLTQCPRLAASTPALVTTACVYSYLLWALDFFLLFLMDLPDELNREIHPGIHGFTGHVFFYGMVLGFYLDLYQQKHPRISRLRFRF